ncbi:hypothetical protein ACSNOI_08455 [Actinomadura kijaniata]|uniref:hypothetical protein n=1 Tax=Actinomadura kijaniata TaxID=46161 RepID=UPI003F1B4B5C
MVGQQGKGVFVRDQADADEPVVSAGDDVLTKQLAEILGAVRDLGDRVARLEESVFQESSKADRSGR